MRRTDAPHKHARIQGEVETERKMWKETQVIIMRRTEGRRTTQGQFTDF